MANLPVVLSEWALETRDISVLASLEYKLLDYDIHLGTDIPDWVGLHPLEITDRKLYWFSEWENSMRAGLGALTSVAKPKISFGETPEFEGVLTSLGTPGNRFRAGLLVVELAAAEAYWPEVTGDEYFMGVIISTEIRKQMLRSVSEKVGFPASFGEELHSALSEVIRELADRIGFPEPQEFKGWRVSRFSHGMGAPFWRGGLTESMNTGIIGATAQQDLIRWSISHLSSGLLMTGDVGLPAAGMFFGAGAALLLAPGLSNVLPPSCVLQPETLLSVAAKYLVFLSKVVKPGEGAAAARSELAELLCRTRGCYLKAARERAGKNMLMISPQQIGAVFDALEEKTKSVTHA